jgi:hypothetical protein
MKSSRVIVSALLEIGAGVFAKFWTDIIIPDQEWNSVQSKIFVQFLQISPNV